MRRVKVLEFQFRFLFTFLVENRQTDRPTWSCTELQVRLLTLTGLVIRGFRVFTGVEGWVSGSNMVLWYRRDRIKK